MNIIQRWEIKLLYIVAVSFELTLVDGRPPNCRQNWGYRQILSACDPPEVCRNCELQDPQHMNIVYECLEKHGSYDVQRRWCMVQPDGYTGDITKCDTPVIEYGSFICSNHDKHIQKYYDRDKMVPATVCEFSCNNAYILNGSKMLECVDERNKSLQWNGSFPHCDLAPVVTRMKPAVTPAMNAIDVVSAPVFKEKTLPIAEIVLVLVSVIVIALAIIAVVLLCKKYGSPSISQISKCPGCNDAVLESITVSVYQLAEEEPPAKGNAEPRNNPDGALAEHDEEAQHSIKKSAVQHDEGAVPYESQEQPHVIKEQKDELNSKLESPDDEQNLELQVDSDPDETVHKEICNSRDEISYIGERNPRDKVGPLSVNGGWLPENERNQKAIECEEHVPLLHDAPQNSYAEKYRSDASGASQPEEGTKMADFANYIWIHTPLFIQGTIF